MRHLQDAHGLIPTPPSSSRLQRLVTHTCYRWSPAPLSASADRRGRRQHYDGEPSRPVAAHPWLRSEDGRLIGATQPGRAARNSGLAAGAGARMAATHEAAAPAAGEPASTSGRPAVQPTKLTTVCDGAGCAAARAPSPPVHCLAPSQGHCRHHRQCHRGPVPTPLGAGARQLHVL